MWYYISTVIEKDDTPNRWHPPPEVKAKGIGAKYAYLFYWAAGLLTGMTVIEIQPETALESWYSTVVVFFGVVMSALVISSTTSAVSSLDAATASYRRDLDCVNGYLAFKRIPPDLCSRINDFYEYVWSTMQHMDKSLAIRELPRTLHLELLLALNMRLLSRVPIFKSTDTRTMILVIKRTKSVIYCPGEYAVRQGSVSKALLMIKRGVMHVLKCADDDERHLHPELVAVLGENDFLGENSLLTTETANASVRSHTYSDLSVLRRSDFYDVAKMSPHLAMVVHNLAEALKRSKEKEMNDDSPKGCPKTRWLKHKRSIMTMTRRLTMDMDRKASFCERGVRQRMSRCSGVVGRSMSNVGLLTSQRSMSRSMSSAGPANSSQFIQKVRPSLRPSMRGGSVIPEGCEANPHMRQKSTDRSDRKSFATAIASCAGGVAATVIPNAPAGAPGTVRQCSGPGRRNSLGGQVGRRNSVGGKDPPGRRNSLGGAFDGLTGGGNLDAGCRERTIVGSRTESLSDSAPPVGLSIAPVAPMAAVTLDTCGPCAAGDTLDEMMDTPASFGAMSEVEEEDEEEADT